MLRTAATNCGGQLGPNWYISSAGVYKYNSKGSAMKNTVIILGMFFASIAGYASTFQEFECNGTSSGWSGGSSYTYKARFDVAQLKGLEESQAISYETQAEDGSWNTVSDFFESKNSSGVLIFSNMYLELITENDHTTLIIDSYQSSGSGGSTAYHDICK
jgi:hypothetical protein